MAPALVPKFVKRQARNLTNHVGARIFHQYDEFTLKGQTFLRQTQEYMHDSIPVKVCTGASKIYSSYQRMRAKEIETFQSNTGVRASDRGRIEKGKRLQQQTQARKITDVKEVERKRVWHAAEQKAIAWEREASARAAQRAQAACVIERCEPRSKVRSVSATQANHPEVDYMTEVRSAHPTSEDPLERSKCIHNGLSSILGPERMSFGVGLASGHTRISDDPILTKYNQDKYTQDTLNLYEQYQALVLQQQEAHQLHEAEQAAELQRKKIQLEVHWYNYLERVWKLAQLGPKFNMEITKLQQAFDNGDINGLQWAAHNLIHEVLEPSNKIFEDMKDQIVLELKSAETLKEAWSVEVIVQILTIFDAQTLSQFQDNVHTSLGCMLQCMQAVCQPILTAKPFINPLDQAPTNLPFVATPVPPTFADFAATMGGLLPPQ